MKIDYLRRYRWRWSKKGMHFKPLIDPIRWNAHMHLTRFPFIRSFNGLLKYWKSSSVWVCHWKPATVPIDSSGGQNCISDPEAAANFTANILMHPTNCVMTVWRFAFLPSSSHDGDDWGSVSWGDHMINWSFIRVFSALMLNRSDNAPQHYGQYRDQN